MATNSVGVADALDSLTLEQREIAGSLSCDRLLVTAGAGAGKTHTLIRRLQYLVEQEELSPGSEILVLTFSRAAVRDIRERLRASAGRVKYVHAATFDSFATRLLSQLEPNGTWQNTGYEERIEAATELLRVGGAGLIAFLEPYRHVLIDELQDLVGIRARFVMRLLSAINAGWTLFGDPAQAIYNFQLAPEERLQYSGEFYIWLRGASTFAVRECSISGNRRARTKEAKQALFAGELLNSASPDYRAIDKQLREIICGLPSVQGIGPRSPIVPALKRDTKRTAILCRNNGQSLLMCERLREAGVPHRMQSAAADRALAPWIANVLSGVMNTSVGRRRVYELTAADPAIDPEAAWSLLKRAEGKAGWDLDLSLLTARIRSGCIPDEMVKGVDIPVVVSTVHRAKGLEFERVIVVEPAENDASEDDGGFEDEVRLLYVALTRPKEELLHTTNPAAWFLRRTASGRWYRAGNESWKRLGMEVRPEDVEWLYPAGPCAIGGPTPRDIQTYLRSSVKSGDEIELHKKVFVFDGQATVRYIVTHQNRPIGLTNDSFSLQMIDVFGKKPSWPEIINNVFVEGIDSVAGADGVARKYDLGWADIWLRVRIWGLGKFRYNK